MTVIEEQKKLGEELKKKREEKNLSLKEAQTATSIRINYLEAIESGEFDKLISSIHAQGFIRQYASFLGIDGDTIIRNRSNIFSSEGNQEFSYGIGTLETRGSPGASIKWIPNAFWIAAFVLIVLSAWYLARYLEVI